jgi:hypothetical protein
MRVIANNTPNNVLNNMSPQDYIMGVIIKAIGDIQKNPTPSLKDYQALKMMIDAFCSIEKNRREEYTLLLKSGIKDDNSVDKQVLKEIEKLLLQGEK